MIRPNTAAPVTLQKSTQQDSIPAVAYYRMSSDKQETSIRDQRAAVERFALHHNYELIAAYADEGISGDATERRIHFQKMVADAAARRFKAILVWDLSRLGRFDIIDGGFWMKPLRDAGVSIVTLDQGEIDWNDIAGRIIWTVQQEGKHQYLRDQARNILRGRLESARRGIRQVRAPYGYRKKRKKLIPGDPLKVKVIRRIFREIRKGESLRGMARKLNRSGIPSSFGGLWTPSAIKGMLANQAYIGDSMWNLRHVGKYCRVVGGEVTQILPSTARLVRGPVEDGIVCKHTHKALIDARTFNAVQKLLYERSAAAPDTRQRGRRYCLVGMLRCGQCGSSMVGSRATTRSNSNRYHCDTNLRRGSDYCSCNAVREHEMLDVILAAIEKHFLQSTKSEERRPKRKRSRITKKSQTITRLKGELAEIEIKLAHAGRRLTEVSRDLLDVVQFQYRNLQSQRCTLQADLQRVRTGESVGDSSLTADRAVEWLARVRASIGRITPPALRDLIREFVRYIEVWTISVRVKKRHFYRLVRTTIHLQGDEQHLVLEYPSGRSWQSASLPLRKNDRRRKQQYRIPERGTATNKWK